MTNSLDVFLQSPTTNDFPNLERTPSSYNPLQTYDLAKGNDKHYQQQYADMYFTRLAMLKKPVEQVAAEAWDDFKIAGETAKKVDRVLAVRQGQLCWIVGTVYMEMPLKPNVLDDISKEHWIAAPPPRAKFTSPNGQDQIMLEDESGRIRLTGSFLPMQLLVTGCIVAVLGTENRDGEFDVVDLKVPDLPAQPERWGRHHSQVQGGKNNQQNGTPQAGKMAIVSGLGINGDEGDTLCVDLLLEYLLGEAAGPESQVAAANISRLLVAGNSISHGTPIPSREDVAAKKKKYGYDPTAYNAAPTERLDVLLATLLPSLPITLLPGLTDPANVSLPQQPLHPALFPHCRAYSLIPGESSQDPGWFDTATNPWQGDVDGWRVLASGGQTVDDVFKYVEGEDRIEMMESMLRWRLVAPTAPDTLWSYPFQLKDAFIISECPHVYIVGNQPKFDTAVIEGPDGQRVRLIAVPKFRDTGELILLDMENLGVEVVKFDLFQKT
ncbi:hypothetical protein EV356DRAFT_510632 [Viridothelium virens]|uniref:DNA-directed DNA polymerase n=1 Tax=Viridothelium virens TaxID=1048519 RepID=A0A6A6HHN0_VIRVR|nr:hypothetical protein EV356DRAFT_510632 [Viridothelium virens]